MVIGNVVYGHHHHSGSCWECVGDLIDAFNFVALCSIVGFNLCHFYAIYWPCTEFLAFTMHCLVIILPKCQNVI